MPPDGKLTPTQHEIMEFVWSAGEQGITVTEIWEAVSARREVIRSTVLNLVDRLEKRCRLRRRKRKGGFRYFPAVKRETAVQELTNDFVNDFFGGLARDLVVRLMRSRRMIGRTESGWPARNSAWFRVIERSVKPTRQKLAASVAVSSANDPSFSRACVN